AVVTRRPPTALEVFALATTALIVAIFLWPAQYHYHFAAFLAPFLGLAIALPISRLLAPGRGSGEDGAPARPARPTGRSLARAAGGTPGTGAGRAPAVAAAWRQEFAHAQYAWLSAYSGRRIAWSPALHAYFTSHFVPVLSDRRGDVLYRRQRSGG